MWGEAVVKEKTLPTVIFLANANMLVTKKEKISPPFIDWTARSLCHPARSPSTLRTLKHLLLQRVRVVPWLNQLVFKSLCEFFVYQEKMQNQCHAIYIMLKSCILKQCLLKEYTQHWLGLADRRIHTWLVESIAGCFQGWFLSFYFANVMLLLTVRLGE